MKQLIFIIFGVCAFYFIDCRVAPNSINFKDLNRQKRDIFSTMFKEPFRALDKVFEPVGDALQHITKPIQNVVKTIGSDPLICIDKDVGGAALGGAIAGAPGGGVGAAFGAAGGSIGTCAVKIIG